MPAARKPNPLDTYRLIKLDAAWAATAEKAIAAKAVRISRLRMGEVSRGRA